MPDLTSIPQLARNLNRVAEIVGVLAKYGLADWVSRLDPGFLRRWAKKTVLVTLTERRHEERVRLALVELGTTFIKLGQMLSTRRDLIGPELADELTRLQSDVQADPFAVTRATIQRELKGTPEELFARFDEIPLASASIGQAHRAELRDGRAVVVKVQHPDIGPRIDADLAILAELAALAEEYVSDARPYRPVAVVTEFRRALVRELDFRRELRYLQIFAKNFRNDPTVKFPVPVPELSTGRVLTMEYLPGTPLNRIGSSLAVGSLPEEVARRGARVFLDMIFRDGFFHADPHPGNVLILPGGVIGLLDGGMVGRVDERLRGQIEAGMVAVMTNDAAAVTDLVIQVGEVPPQFDSAGLQTEIAEQMAFYWGMPLERFNLGTALDEMTEAIRRYHILLPPPVAMLLKVLVMLEGTARLLNPTFNLIEVLEPYRRQFVRRRLSPRRLTRRFLTTARDWDEVMQGMPRMIRDLMQFARRQHFAVQLQHQHLEPSVNRLVFGMMTSALFLGSALLWAFKAPPTVHIPGLVDDVSVFGVIGCFLSGMLGYRLFRAIQKSGKLEDQ
ncbi:ABC1 kinase family protein [Fimbriiglobus ruber]|uniref:Ubiquinone biosynthesis monooxygenase UbiB n=1 Tax=Fimbriiglobus ruber TaxID=1908690 RepID=A0A225D2U1_9BACT|nr:AarF/ABC1/UbiB kinase family protein [Fimbriiglobus ruber]OWK35910.1 Ubiquinone biosynthesis monooxygenase UbiB [Fimbriiglobus ruber]